MAPRWCKIADKASKADQDSAIWSQDGSEMDPIWCKIAHRTSKEDQDFASWPQMTSIWPQYGLKVAPKGFSIISSMPQTTKLISNTNKIGGGGGEPRRVVNTLHYVT